VDVHVYARDFAADRASGRDEGCVLVTSGMSDRLMAMPEGYDGDESAARELLWYVRAPHQAFIERLRWLAKSRAGQQRAPWAFHLSRRAGAR